ncbi:hypothetical protein GYMLUDRAFT_39937 [Collybiopsis luxurians FD-317 M1]|nr:hypothetical protein GYMLUDRAFT_39937 [Collybiopsis luxurians FD-317 M1]
MSDIHTRLKSIITDDPQSWETAWKENVTPWDFGETQPPLKQVIEGGEVSFPKGGRALVPGCGKGYDAIYLAAKLDHDALGIDVSTTAFNAANELVRSNSADPELASRIRFEATDFFKYEIPEDKKFDLIYDYTFFVAIPPSRRSDWGSQMNTLIKPGGYLVTLMFPQHPAPYSGGPPFYSNFASYEEVLGNGWEVVLDRIPDEATLTESHKGKDRIVVWKRKI